MNSEEPLLIEERHYLRKTLQSFAKSTESASEWFLSTIYLSLVGLFPNEGLTKKDVIPTPGIMLFRLIIYVENIENLTHCINKKTGIPTRFQKTTGDIVSRGQKYFAHPHRKENNEKFKFKFKFNNSFYQCTK